MKKNIFFITLLFASVACAQKVSITGQLTGAVPGSGIRLTNELASFDVLVNLDPNGAFKVSIPTIKKGFYSLTKIGTIYLEPGYSLLIKPNKDSTGYTFSGFGSAENNAFANSRTLLKEYFPINDDMFLFEVYRLDVDSFITRLNEYKNAAYKLMDKSSSQFYKTLAKKDLTFYSNQYAKYYPIFYGIDSVKQDEYVKMTLDTSLKPGDTARMKKLILASMAMRIKTLSSTERQRIDSLLNQDWDMNDSLLFINSSMYRQAVKDKISSIKNKEYKNAWKQKGEGTLAELEVSQKRIQNALIRNYFLSFYTSQFIKSSKDSIRNDSVYTAFLKKCTNTKLKSEVSLVYNNYLNTLNNKISPNFIFSGLGGETVSLESLRGKYVYIDVWATWCVPCKKEIPFLSELEEKYKDKNIHFVSLSVDKQEDKQKWMDYVTTKNLKGIQIMADKDFNSDFIKKFNINSIPRFILIAPDGKIVASDAKRPSDPELVKQFDGLL